MGSNEIWHEVRIKAAPAKVFAALTQPDLLGRWWIPDASGRSVVGGILTFPVNANFSQDIEVLEIQQDSRILWRPRNSGLDDWHGSKIEFTLSKIEMGTALQFRHFDYKDGVAGFPYYSLSWALFLLSLRALLETGKGFPIKPDGSQPDLMEFPPAYAA